MEDSFGMGIVYTITIMLGTFVTVLFMSLGYDHHIQLKCDRAVEKLVDDSRTNGYISYQNYLDFCNELGSTGYIYNVTVKHESNISVPSSTDNGYENTFMTYYQDEILPYMFEGPDQGNNNGYLNYPMKNGDNITVSYSINCESFSSIMLGLITIHHPYKTIYGGSSGKVGNNAVS